MLFASLKNLLHVLRRFKTASALNLLGLSVAFAAFLIVAMHVRYEYSYYRDDPEAGRIFRLEYIQDDNFWKSNYSRPLATYFCNYSPHIEASGLLMTSLGMPFYFTLEGEGGEAGFQEDLRLATPGLADVFQFDMVEGSAKALETPDLLLIPQSIARKMFGNESAVGRMLELSEFPSRDGKFELWGAEMNTRLTVGGVYRDFPGNAVLPNHIFTRINDRISNTDWHTGAYYCYVKFDDPAQAATVTDEFMTEYEKPLKNWRIHSIRLSPITGVYFDPPIEFDPLPVGNKAVTDTLMLVALLIVLIASINFVNFSVALTPLRIKSINTRKVLGSTPGALRRGLVLEALLITLMAFVLGLFWVWTIQESRWLDGLVGEALSLKNNPGLIALTGALAGAVGLFSGLYPARHMTSFPTAMVLNGSFALSGKAKFVRQSLIGFQYVVSIALVICALFIHIQNQYVNRLGMGFDKDHILQFKLSMDQAATQSDRIRQLMTENTAIRDVAFTQLKFVSDEIKPYIGVDYKGEHYYHFEVQVSWNFPELIGVAATKGRNFQRSDEYRADGKSTWLYNQSAADMMQLQVGDSINTHGKAYIAGIFPDIHFESMHRAIQPMGFVVSPPGHWDLGLPPSYAYAKVQGGHTEEAIAHIRRTMAQIDPAFPVEIDFFDRTLDELYKKSHNQGLMVTLFSLLAVLLSVVGVFGLVVFEAQGRTREIAVRRVMGASVREILLMFNTGFVRIVLICFVVAAPLAWYGVKTWLESFAYRTPLHGWVFALAFILVLLLTVLTVTFQSYRSATANPARSLQK